MKSFWQILGRFLSLAVVMFCGAQVVCAQVTRDVNVSGAVRPNDNSFQLAITPSTINTLSQDTNITYTITYGANLGSPEQLIIEAEWGYATVGDAAIPTIDLVQINDGSATEGFAGTPAVIDKVNHKIRWTINSFPAHTDNQKVAFSMNTNFSYMSEGRLTFPVTVRLINPLYTTIDRTVISSYEYDRNRSTPFSYTGPTPSPTPIIKLDFSRLLVRSISETQIELYVITTKKADLEVKYGTEIWKPTQTLELSPSTWTSVIRLKDLKPATTYYVVISAKSGSETIKSNILKLTTVPGTTTTFTTQLDRKSLVFVSSDIATLNPTEPENPDAVLNLVLPKDITYIFAFRLNQPQSVERVQAILLDNRILGFNTDLNQTEERNIYALDLMQITPGSYQGKLRTPNISGDYQLVAQIYDADGRIISEPLADISVSEPLTVYDQNSKKPVEKAQIKLTRLDSQTGTFKLLPAREDAIRISGYTDNNGRLTFFLPTGTYNIEIDSIGYKREIKNFAIGTENNKRYPTFYLTPEPLSFMSFFYYYGNISVDFINTSLSDIHSLANSNRYFELNAFLVMCFLIIFAFLAFRARIHIPILSMFDYFFHLGKMHLYGNTGNEKITGKITDKQNGNILSDCDVFLSDYIKQTVVGHVHTDNNGTFSFLLLPQIKYALQITKPGYQMVFITDLSTENNSFQGTEVKMENIYHKLPIRMQVYLFFRNILETLFEILLLSSLLLEIAMTIVWGWEKTIIFLIISTLNLILWVVHLIHQGSQSG